jgi:hypothetical protein
MAVVGSGLMQLMRAIATGDVAVASQMLAVSPVLACTQLERGATRQTASDFFLEDIAHYVYAGDTPLHVAAAGYRVVLAQTLVSGGADFAARNRRGAQPLHYAADGAPGSARWDPEAQAATIAYLISAGADPDATDISGVAPIHRAVRTRCAAAVSALIEGGADVDRRNRAGSTPIMLATLSTGKGGSGSPEAKSQQQEILRILRLHGGRA